MQDNITEQIPDLPTFRSKETVSEIECHEQQRQEEVGSIQLGPPKLEFQITEPNDSVVKEEEKEYIMIAQDIMENVSPVREPLLRFDVGVPCLPKQAFYIQLAESTF